MAAGGGTVQAQGQVYVLESTATNVKVGTAFAMSDRITVPAGASVRVVMPSGKTQMIKGPYSGVAADLAKGQKANDGVVAWIKNLVQTGGSNEKTPGATRSARAPEQPAAFSWTAIPVTANSTICVEKGAKLQLRRAAIAKRGSRYRRRPCDRRNAARRHLQQAAKPRRGRPE